MNRSTSCSDISLDSLEENFKNKSILKEKSYEEQVETILVPFYENDVLIRVPKLSKERKCNQKNRGQKNSKFKKEPEPQSYLINKNIQNNKKCSYLDIFRKQFVPNSLGKKKQTEEIRSISPQVGDTETGSLDDEGNNNESEFYNTEAYNDVYYEQLINQDMEYYLDQSLEELQLSQDLEIKLEDDDNNLKSVSEVTQPRRERRRGVQPLHNMKLGGLGPDMENIRPRLERARSLQRYSEKVRMENRLRIYKKAVEEDKETLKRQASAKNSQSARNRSAEEKNTYLINKNMKEKSSLIKKIYHGKSKSASVQISKTRENKPPNETNDKREQIPKKSTKNLHIKKNENCGGKVRIKSIKIDKGTDTDDKQYRNEKTRPMEINFLVNIDAGLRPSSALRNLEEKHRQYQEKVKTFCTDYRND
ncbi:uncharacterized protein LOC123714829 [Pieris brassicae]|uniref:Uncharacterized protein n=1 Tax=Pieris brassicae TaxID=7116 RepID=A0A9P0TJJ8_PIEBR|nr:uncharacterized protein LOC123714829 [Pieris brassicae]CAH4032879.1 unnamed protein product [Pieris brassicae]